MSSPRVWLRFERSLNDGTVKKFKVQEVLPSLYEKVIEFMSINFLPEGPLARAANLLSDPNNFECIKRYWLNNILPQNFSVVCLEDDDTPEEDKEIVGVNFLLLISKTQSDKTESLPVEPTSINVLLSEVASRFDVFEVFGVDRFLSACGLSVNKNYRGLSIGTELLLARTPICKEHNITLTKTIFTGVAAQKVATKAGFITVLEIDFQELADKMNVTFPEGFKTLKVMTKLIE